MQWLRRFAVLISVVWSAAAAAWPVDLFVEVNAGEERFVRFQGVEWITLEDAQVATAEAFPSGEVLVTGVSKGSTLLMLYGQGRFSVWRVRVLGPGEARARPATDALAVASVTSAVTAACPRAVIEPSRVVVHVRDERCRQAVRMYLEKAPVRADQTDLTFELEALQTQLRDLGQGVQTLGLGERVQLRYVGAGLVLTGTVTADEHRRLLWEIFRRSAGRAALDDQLTRADPAGAEDGGAAAVEALAPR